MSESIYDDKFIEPNDKMLTYDLGIAMNYLDKICKFIEKKYGNIKPE